MARTGDVQRSIWTANDDFIDLSPDAKLLYLWSFTNNHCNVAGLYRISERVMAFEATLPADRFTAAFAELREARFLIYEDGVLWVRSHWKHFRTKSPNTFKGVENDLRSLEAHPLVAQFADFYKGSSSTFEGLSEFTSTKRNQEAPSEPLEGLQGRVRVKGKEGGVGETKLVESPDLADLKLPDHLHPAFRSTWPILLEVAKAKKAKLKPSAVASSLARHPDRDPVDAAESFRFWHLDGTGENVDLKNAAQGYDRWLRTSKTSKNGRVPSASRHAEELQATQRRLEEAER